MRDPFHTALLWTILDLIGMENTTSDVELLQELSKEHDSHQDSISETNERVVANQGTTSGTQTPASDYPNISKAYWITPGLRLEGCRMRGEGVGCGFKKSAASGKLSAGSFASSINSSSSISSSASRTKSSSTLVQNSQGPVEQLTCKEKKVSHTLNSQLSRTATWLRLLNT